MKVYLLRDILAHPIAGGALIHSCLVSVHSIQSKDGCNHRLFATRQQVVTSRPGDLGNRITTCSTFQSNRGSFLRLHSTVWRDVLYPWRHCNSNMTIQQRRIIVVYFAEYKIVMPEGKWIWLAVNCDAKLWQQQNSNDTIIGQNF